jgi:hypothetical protein
MAIGWLLDLNRVIPGREAKLSEPEIHNHESGLWIPGLQLRSAVADLSCIPE